MKTPFTLSHWLMIYYQMILLHPMAPTLKNFLFNIIKLTETPIHFNFLLLLLEPKSVASPFQLGTPSPGGTYRCPRSASLPADLTPPAPDPCSYILTFKKKFSYKYQLPKQFHTKNHFLFKS